MWKNFRTNLMYWRFRHITRNRLRLQSWYHRRRQPTTVWRERGTATYVYRRSGRRTWIILIVMVSLLTALQVLSSHAAIGSSLVWAASVLIIVLSVYWAVRGI